MPCHEFKILSYFKIIYAVDAGGQKMHKEGHRDKEKKKLTSHQAMTSIVPYAKGTTDRLSLAAAAAAAAAASLLLLPRQLMRKGYQTQTSRWGLAITCAHGEERR